MSKTIWYISKYVVPPHNAKVGARGFLILREFARFGHRAVLVTSDSNHLATPPRLDGPRLFETVDCVDVCWLRTRQYQGARSPKRILSWFDFEWQVWRIPHRDIPRPDVVIVSSLSLLTIFNGLRLRQRYGCKLVFEIRDIWPMILVVAGRMSPRHPAVRFLGWVERLGYRRADLIVGTMPNLEEHVAEVSGSQVPVVCIPQGVDPALLDAAQPLQPGYTEQYLPEGKFLVCHAGSIGADNALETLFECARQMKARSEIHFLIVGEGYLKKKFMEMTADLPNLSFAPGVPKAAVQSLLNRVDLLYFAVHKSPMLRFGQSLNKVVDYMLSGKPIVASYTGFPSMINEAECGTFVPAEDAAALRAEIERYAEMSSVERAKIGMRGRQWILHNRRFESLAAKYLLHLGIDAPNTGDGKEDHV